MSRIISRYLLPFYLTLCLVLGGASAAGYLANGALQIAGIGCLVIVVLNHRVPALSRRAWQLLGLFGLGMALLVVESVPIPSVLWSLLPGRTAVLGGYQLLGIAPPWLPLSLAPDQTLATLCSLIPPLAVAVLTFASSGFGRTYAISLLVILSVGSIFLGVLQHVQGPDSSYYIYEITNRGGVVGAFANRNHLVSLLLMAIPFAGMLAVVPKRRTDTDSKLGRRMICGCIILLLSIGIIIVHSAAGWILLLPMLFAAAAIYMRGEKGRIPPGLLQTSLIVGVIAIGLAIFAPVQSNDLGDKLSGIDPHTRNLSIRTTARAALDYLPFGSGAGSFQQIYPQYEDPESASQEYLNHAHDDYVEIFLEHGIPGLILVALAIWWWAAQTGAVWRLHENSDGQGRAGYVAVGVLIVHSLVDYPGRTAAIAATVAMAAALMVAPTSEEAPVWQSRRQRRSSRRGERSIEIALAPRSATGIQSPASNARP